MDMNSADNSAAGSSLRPGAPLGSPARSENDDNWKRLDQAVWNVLRDLHERRRRE